MAPYQAFLLPLLKTVPAERVLAEIRSPLDEETHLRKQLGDQLDWDEWAKLVHKEYGLPMITEGIHATHQVRESAMTKTPDSGRFIILDGNSGSWFVMEHPSALPLFDKLGEPDQLPLLARPSLFSEWYGSATRFRTSDEDTDQHQVIEEDGYSTTAFKHFLQDLIRSNPSDWHLEPAPQCYRSRLRVEGKLTPSTELPVEKGQWLINSVIQYSKLGGHAAATPLDGKFTIPGEQSIPARVSLVPSISGYSLSIRFLYPENEQFRDFRPIGLSDHQISLIEETLADPDGLWLVAGPTGSGKSTTLHAILQHFVDLNEKILSVEDPVEYSRTGVQQVQVDERSGFTFSTALRAFMRQSPDTILIGEVRDRETAAIAIQAALTGHRILATVHASSNEGILHRFEDLGQEVHQLKPATRIVIHQRLIRLLCQSCRMLTAMPDNLLQSLLKGFSLRNEMSVAVGCRACHSGYSGRSGVFSISKLDPSFDVRNELARSALHAFKHLKTDLPSILSLLSPSIRNDFRFANCKDSANYSDKHTPLSNSLQ
jgi:type II secretory ATPase GspE/PulE/Tfp pilus assembly ATPase PilB-like protein